MLSLWVFFNINYAFLLTITGCFGGVVFKIPSSDFLSAVTPQLCHFHLTHLKIDLPSQLYGLYWYGNNLDAGLSEAWAEYVIYILPDFTNCSKQK